MFLLLLYTLGMIFVIYLQNRPIDLLEQSMIALSRKFKFSSLVAGATFIAITSSSPEFGTAFAGVMFERTFEIGFQAIIWSAIFNILIITGISGIVLVLAGLVPEFRFRTGHTGSRFRNRIRCPQYSMASGLSEFSALHTAWSYTGRVRRRRRESRRCRLVCDAVGGFPG